MDLTVLKKGWLPVVRGVMVAGLALGAVFAVACSDDDGENDANPPSLPAATVPGGNAVSTSTAGGVTGTATSGSSAPTVQLTARDFAYDINDSIVGGLVRLEMRNTGQEPHHAQFARLNDGVTQAQFTAALQNPDPTAALGMISLAGGPGIIQPGQTQVVYDTLAAGKYTLLCFVESADGLPHAAKGMVDFIDVTAPTGAAATPPTAQSQMTVADFSFTGGDTVPASRTTVEVTNNGPAIRKRGGGGGGCTATPSPTSPSQKRDLAVVRTRRASRAEPLEPDAGSGLQIDGRPAEYGGGRAPGCRPEPGGPGAGRSGGPLQPLVGPCRDRSCRPRASTSTTWPSRRRRWPGSTWWARGRWAPP